MDAIPLRYVYTFIKKKKKKKEAINAFQIIFFDHLSSGSEGSWGSKRSVNVEPNKVRVVGQVRYWRGEGS